MNKVRTAVAGVAVAGLAALLSPTAAQADGAAWQGSCAKGDFCVWSGQNGTGTKCAWDGDDPDWRGGNVQCKPRFLVASYWNNGYTGSYSRVKVYHFANYDGYWGTIDAGKRGSFWEGQLMNSHKWAN